jgi:uncharacterized protein (UPF0212 family)
MGGEPMTISQAIDRLTKLRADFGDVEVLADCEACGHETTVGTVIALPSTTTARLRGEQ